MQDLAPPYYGCPDVCGFDDARISSEYCKACPVKTEKDEFRKAFTSVIQQRLPNHWKNYPFEHLERTLYTIFELRETDRTQRTIKAAALLAIYDVEKERLNMIEDYNFRNKPKS